MKKTFTLAAITFLGLISIEAQVGINTPSPDASAILQLESSSKGLRLPKVALTTTTTFGLATPTNASVAIGMTVYNTTPGLTSSNSSYPAAGVGAYTWDGTGWAAASAAAAAVIQDLRAVGTGFFNHVTKDAGVGSNGTSLGTGGANIAIGTSAMASITNGNNNVGIAINALGQNTTGSNNVAIGAGANGQNSTASDNIAIGNNALYFSNGTNGGNIAIGGLALNKNTGVGTANVGIGQNALTNNTSAGANVAVGTSAMAANTTGANNTAVGQDAMGTNQTGIQNTALGFLSLYNNKGNFNTGLGVAAGSSITTGTNNTALGYSSLSNGPTSITGSNNTAVGVGTLSLTTTGSQNTAVGYQSGVNMGTGNNNTFLGWNSGSTVTTGSQNIAIGYQTQLPSATTSNQMNIGSAIYGTGISTSTPRIGIGAGATTPRTELDIVSQGFYGLIVSSDISQPIAGFTGLAPQNGVAISQYGHIDVQSDVSSATSTGYALLNLGRISTSVNGDVFVNFNRGGASIGRIVQNGTTAVAYNTTSDERLKENIRPTAFSIKDVMKIDVRDYTYKAEKGREQTGFIAQQLFTVYPNAVTQGGDDAKTNPWMVDYGKVTPLLVKAIQDQQAEITDLKARLESLENLIKGSTK